MWVGGVRVVVLKDNKILMVRQHHDGRDIWMLPGGGIEDKETSVDAAIREVKEETGLNIDINKLIWFIEELRDDGSQRFVNFFLANVLSGTLTVGTDPERDEKSQVIRQVKFLSKEEVENVENIYPENLREELWQYIEEKPKHNLHKFRAKEGRKNYEF